MSGLEFVAKIQCFRGVICLEGILDACLPLLSRSRQYCHCRQQKTGTGENERSNPSRFNGWKVTLAAVGKTQAHLECSSRAVLSYSTSNLKEALPPKQTWLLEWITSRKRPLVVPTAVACIVPLCTNRGQRTMMLTGVWPFHTDFGSITAGRKEATCM